jgi:hypothetical protein
VTVFLDGTLRNPQAITAVVINAKFGDVIRLTNGTPLKYQGEKAKAFAAVHPVD